MKKTLSGYNTVLRYDVEVPFFNCMHHSDPKQTLLQSFVAHHTPPSLFQVLPVVYKLI